MLPRVSAYGQKQTLSLRCRINVFLKALAIPVASMLPPFLLSGLLPIVACWYRGGRATALAPVCRQPELVICFRICQAVRH